MLARKFHSTCFADIDTSRYVDPDDGAGYKESITLSNDLTSERIISIRRIRSETASAWLQTLPKKFL